MRETAKATIESTHARLIAGKLLIIAALAVGVTQLSAVSSVDLATVELIHRHTTNSLTAVFLGITELASTDVILLVSAGAAVLLAARHHWRGAVALAISVLATQAVVTGAKALMSRPRPDQDAAVVDPSGFSFPSAHSASAVALYAMLALIAASAMRGRARGSAWTVAIALVVAIGLSRVYLGAHYPTDVLAGWLIGGVVVLGSWTLCSRLPAGRPAV
ncbi:MAG TPA: phosphatase PAP2 family protein [Solirubrobacterales bacterium]|nr:phosphatase PAP2 family protein [Solirubrobacterales bacterium]